MDFFFQESDDLTESRNAPFNDKYDVDDDDGEETDLVSYFDFVNTLFNIGNPNICSLFSLNLFSTNIQLVFTL